MWGEVSSAVKQLGEEHAQPSLYEVIFPESWGKISESEWRAEEGGEGVYECFTAPLEAKGKLSRRPYTHSM